MEKSEFRCSYVYRCADCNELLLTENQYAARCGIDGCSYEVAHVLKYLYIGGKNFAFYTRECVKHGLYPNWIPVKCTTYELKRRQHGKKWLHEVFMQQGDTRVKIGQRVSDHQYVCAMVLFDGKNNIPYLKGFSKKVQMSPFGDMARWIRRDNLPYRIAYLDEKEDEL